MSNDRLDRKKIGKTEIIATENKVQKEVDTLNVKFVVRDATLASLQAQITALGVTVASHTTTLASHTGTLANHETRLDNHGI